MASQYAASVSTACVGQIAYIVGFENAHSDALNATAGVLMRFIKEVGLYSREAAELQNRTDVNVLDVVDALSDFGISCSDLYEFVQSELRSNTSLGGPVHNVFDFPVRLPSVLPPRMRLSADGSNMHIPAHLPAFPDPHTIRATPVRNKRQAKDVQPEAVQRDVQQRKAAEQTLVRLHQRLHVVPHENPFAPKDAVELERFGHVRVPKGTCPESLRYKVRREAFILAIVLALLCAGSTEVCLRDAFKDVFAAEEAARGAPSADAGRLQGDEGSPDVEGMDEDERGSSGWAMSDLNEKALAGPTQNRPVVEFSIYASTQVEREAIRARQTCLTQDAFTTVQEPMEETYGRRRGVGGEARSRAQEILDKGPDAILMAFDGGVIPRNA